MKLRRYAFNYALTPLRFRFNFIHNKPIPSITRAEGPSPRWGLKPLPWGIPLRSKKLVTRHFFLSFHNNPIQFHRKALRYLHRVGPKPLTGSSKAPPKTLDDIFFSTFFKRKERDTTQRIGYTTLLYTSGIGMQPFFVVRKGYLVLTEGFSMQLSQ